jgi:hypothetical protein
MEGNKYFNSSNQTVGGKPKFVPPQKRVQQQETVTQEIPQQKVEPKVEVQESKPFLEKSYSMPSKNLFKRY